MCNMCFKLLQNQDKIKPQIQIIWTENRKYMVLQTFIDHFWTKCLEWKISNANVVKLRKKLLKFT